MIHDLKSSRSSEESVQIKYKTLEKFIDETEEFILKGQSED